MVSEICQKGAMHGGRKVSGVVRKVSDGVKKVTGGVQKV